MAASAGIILPGQSAANTTLPAATYLTLFALTLAYANPGPLPAYKDSNGNTHQLMTNSGGSYYNVQDYGILPSNSAATNSANIATLLANISSWSELFFPSGTYQFSSAISVGALSGIIFQGAGQYGTVLQTTSATADIVTLTDSNWYTEFRDLSFSTSVPKTAGNCITTGTASGAGNVGISVRRCNFSGSSATNTLYNGIVYAGTQSGNVTLVYDCTFSNFSNYGIYVQGNTSTPASSANISIINVTMNGAITAGNAAAGFYFLQCGSAQIANCDVISCTNNMLLGGTSATSSGVFSIDTFNCYFDDSAGSCLLMQGTCNIERCSFVNVWFTTAGTSGLSAVQSTNTSTIGITGITFTACQLYNTYGTTGTSYGFNITGAKDFTVQNTNIAGFTNGFAITPYSAANYTTVKLWANTIGPVGNIAGNTNGIVLNAGSFAYNDILITDNDLAGNTTAPLVNNASGWTSLNIGQQPGLASPSVPLTAASAVISTTATYFTPTTPIPAGALLPGTTFRITASGLCTSTVANSTTFSVRLGTAGTTADTAVYTLSVAAATSGTNVPFKLEATVTIRSIGSGGAAWGSAFLINSGTTGISSTGFAVGSATATAAVNTTVKNFVGISAATAATTTSITIEEASVEVLNAA